MSFRLVRLDDTAIEVAHGDGHSFTFCFSPPDDGPRDLMRGDVHLSSSDDDGAFWYSAAYRYAASKAARAGKIALSLHL